nr:hypothetical protein [Tanacetum cinerariifolium]
MDRSVSWDEIRVAIWNCSENKSPGPEGYTFEFFRRYWRFIGSDFCSAVECFFESGSFPKGRDIGCSLAVSSVRLLNVSLKVGHFLREATSLIGCTVMQNPFRYLGGMDRDSMSQKLAWADMIQKLRSRLSKWKVKTLSIGGVLKEMEAIRCNFFNGADPAKRKITWVSWDKVPASKKNGGLGVSSFHALNRALLLMWVWRFLSQDGSLWYRVIQALYGAFFEFHPVNQYLIWCSILREMQVLISKGFDFVSHCKKRVEDEKDKESTVASKLGPSSVDASFRRSVSDRVERQQWDDLNSVLGSVTLFASKDRWICDLNGDGVFRVKEMHVFAWHARLDRLSTRSNLVRRGVVLDSSLCPLYGWVPEDIHHVLFRCDTAKLVVRRICRWCDFSKTFSDL